MIGRGKKRNPLGEIAAITIIDRDKHRGRHRDRYATTTEKGTEKRRGTNRRLAGSTISSPDNNSTLTTNQTPTPESEHSPRKPAIALVARPTSDQKTLVPSYASSNKKRIRNV